MTDDQEFEDGVTILGTGRNPDVEKWPVVVDLLLDGTPRNTKTFKLTEDTAQRLRDALDEALGQIDEAREHHGEPDPDDLYEAARDSIRGL